MSYLNIHCHSVYSKKDAISEPIDIAKINKEYGNDAFVITDHGDLGAWIQAYQAADKLDMQFIPGCEFYMLPDKEEFWAKNVKEDDVESAEHTAKYFHFIAIAKNQNGVKSLVTIYNTHVDHYGKPCVTKKDLFEHSDGLIVTNACVSGEILFYLRNGYDNLAENSLLELKNHFGDDFYVELQYHNLTFMDEVSVYNKLVELAKKHNVKMIATTDSHFNYKEDSLAHNIYKDIYKENYKYSFDDGFARAFDGEGYYIKNEQEIRESIKNITALTQEDIDKIISNTQEIRNKCEKTEFPKALPLSNKEKELWDMVNSGWERKRKNTDLEQVSKDRIQEEMSTICEMGFTEYFINMYNILKRAKMLGILTGPARGSAAGSEVCYLLGIVKIDPIKNNLIFSRFLHKKRWNFPDIDTDIQSRSKRPGMSGKDVLIESLSRDLFPFSGQIVNEMRASTIILFKQLAKVFGIKFQDVNRVTTDSEVASEFLEEDTYTGWLPNQLSKLNISWDERWAEFEKYIWFCYKYGGHERGDKAAGLLWNTSIHASGVILYPSKDKNLLPKNSQGVTYRGHDLEKMGYIKYDLLGLASLDPIGYFLPKIMEDKGLDPKKDEFDWEDTNDKDTWEVFKSADTDFVFQFASPGMKRALRMVKPDNITTLAELNALYRPGCIKSGTFEAYITDSFTDEQKVVGQFLKEEFGEDHSLAMIFQEDIMKVCEKMAGFDMADADLVRRAMQRKEKDTMESYKEQFLRGFNKEKYGNIAEQVWDAIDACAAYVFNLSHSVAYACIAYWTAYIFCHYKNEFFEYMLNTDQDKQEVIRYLSKTRNIVFPSLETKNTDYVVTNKDVLIPTTAVSDQTVAEYLLSLTPEKKKMIVKFGVLDSFCVDRKGLRDLLSEIPAKKINDLSSVQKASINCSTFDTFMKSMQALDLFDYTKNGGVYNISVKKTRSDKDMVVRSIPNKEILKHNCQEDVRQFGIVRSKYVDKAPEINLDSINERFISFKGDSEDRDMRKTLQKIGEKDPLLSTINSENTFYKAVMKEAKLSGWPKVKLVFSDDIIEVGIMKYGGVSANIKAMEKNTPVEVRLKVELYQKDGEVKHSIKIVEISEREF